MAGEVDGSGRRKSTRPQVRLSTLFVGMLAGVLIGATAITAQGSDLRPDRTSDVAQLVAEAEARNQELSQRAADLRAETDRPPPPRAQRRPVPTPARSWPRGRPGWRRSRGQRSG